MPFEDGDTAGEGRFVWKNEGWHHAPTVGPVEEGPQLKAVAPKPLPGSELQDSAIGMSKALGSGIVHEGVPGLFGLPGDVGELVGHGVDWAANKLGIKKPETPGKNTNPGDAVEPGHEKTLLEKVRDATSLPTSEGIRNPITKVIPEYEPKNFAERTAKTVGSFAPMAALAPEGVLAGLGRYAAAPGIASQGAGELVGKISPEAAPWASMAAALTAPFAARKLMTPNRVVSPYHSDMVTALKGEGVNSLSAGQQLGDIDKIAKEAHYVNSPMSGTSASNENTRQLRELTKGAFRHAGLEADLTSPANIEKMITNNSNEFNRLTTKYDMPFDSSTDRRFKAAVKDYKGSNVGLSPEPEQIASEIEALSTKGNPPGFLTGRQYQNIRSRLGSLSVKTDDPQAGRALTEMRHALDDAMERSIKMQGPNDLGAFKDVRDRYHNQLIVQKAAAAGGTNAAGGVITPPALSGAVRAIDGEEEVARQTRPLTKLARSAEGVMTPLPATKPESHLGLAAVLAGGAEAANRTTLDNPKDGLGYRDFLSPLLGGIVGALGSRVGPGLYGRAMFGSTGPAVRGYLANQLAPSTPMTKDRMLHLLTAKVLMEGGRGQDGQTPPSTK